MSDCGCHDTAATLSKNTDHARRRVLWVVLAINVLLFVGEFSAGWWADSSALQADSLDSLGDALVYILSLWVIGGTLRQRTKAVFLKGGIQALFGLAVLVEVGRRAWLGAEPVAPIRAVVWPGWAVKLMSCSASSSAPNSLKVLRSIPEIGVPVRP